MDRRTAFGRDGHQVSPGGLNHIQNIQSAASQWVIAELDIQNIQPFQQIPDYTSPTTSPVPIVVISPASCTCIDGWDLIQSAKSSGSSTIACYAFYIPEHSQTEIAIRKVAIRTMPQGGICSYAELVRNAGILFNMLMASTDNPALFSHGGPRKGASCLENTENDVRKLLANRLGKSVTTISKYLNHGDCIDDAAMEKLIDAAVPKQFFEAFQRHKQPTILALEFAQTNDKDVVARISSDVLNWLVAFKRQSIPKTPPKETSPLSQACKTGESSGGNKHSKPGQGATLTDARRTDTQVVEVGPLDEQGIETDLKRIGEALIEIADDRRICTAQHIESLKEFIQELAALLQRLVHTGANDKDRKEGEL